MAKCKFRRYKHDIKYKECTEECKHYEFCTRNPNRKENKEDGTRVDINSQAVTKSLAMGR